MKKRVLASLLALCMVIGMLPATALAAEAPQTVEGSNGAVAKIGNTAYPTLAEALTYVVSDDTIVMLADVQLDESVEIPADKTITLDLNGKTISQSKECTDSYSMIANNGSLTITGNGKLSFTDTGAGDPDVGWASYTIRNAGTLVVENGTIEHLGKQTYNGNNAIFNYSGSTTINGGTISIPYSRSVRLWHGTVTINDGSFDGQVWVQAMENCSLTINGGSFKPATNGYDGSSVFVTNSTHVPTLSVTGGTFETKIGCSDASKLAGAITGGKFTESAKTNTNAALLAESCSFGEIGNDGYYTVIDTRPVENTTTGVKYDTLAGAISAAQSGDTITLLDNVELADGVTVPAGATVTLDLNGKVLSGNTEGAEGSAVITNYGTLSIQDSSTGKTGKITAFAANPDTASVPSYANNTISNSGTLNLYSGTIENSTGDEARACFPIDNNSAVGRNAVLNIYGGTVTGRGAIRQFTTTANYVNIVNITGGTIYGRSYALWLQNPAGTAGNANGELNIEGGTLSKILLESSSNFDVAISGGEITEVAYWSPDTANPERIPTGFVFGGTFSTDPTAYLAEGYVATQNGETGKYEVTDGRPVVNTTTGEKYTTLTKAIAAAQAGDTITLLENVTLTETLTVTKNVVIDLNEHAVTGPSGNYGFIFNVEEGASLTVKNGTLNSSGYAIGSAGAATTANKIILDTVIINAETVGIYHNGSYYGADVTITESTIEVEDGCGVFLSGSADWATSEKKNSLVITESTIIGDTAVEVKCGDVTVTDSTLEAGLEVAERNSVSGNCTVGYALALTNGGTSQKAEASMGIVTINSGVFTGVIGIKDEDSTDVVGNTTDAKITIYGGTFSTDPTAYLAEGYVATKSGSTWTVAIPTPAAKVGETSYFTLDAAIAAAQKGDTVTLLKDIVTSTYIEISKPLTLNLNGFDIIREGNGTGLSVEDIALNEVVNIVGEGTIDAGTQALMALGGTVNIYGGTFVGGKAVLADYDSRVSIYGGTFSSKEQDGNVLAMGNACTTAFIKVYGGTFLNFDPANYVADGYVSVAGSNNAYTIAVKTVTGVTLDKVSLAMNPGDTATLTAAVSPADALNREISWSSDNTAVATVENGTVIAVAAGSAIITVTTADGGYTATCEVTVADNSGAGEPEPEPEPEPTPTPTPDYSDDDYVPSNPTVSTETTENEDGSTTTTETKQDGTTVETTTNSDGSSTKTETKTEVKETAGTTTTTTTSKVETKDAEGNKTSVESTEKVVETVDTTIKTTETTTTTEARIETVKTEEKVVTDENGTKTTTTTTETATKLDNGSTGTTKTDETGKTEAAVEVSTQAVAEAAKAEAPVVLAMPALEVSKQAETSATVTVTLPADTAEAAVAIPVAENAGEGTVAVLVNDDGTETILTNAVITESGLVANVPNGATVKVVDNSADFHDVADDAWEKGAVDFTSSRNITNGTGAGFSPDMVTSRAMVWTMLARLEGVNTDPAEGEDWWTAGQKWAVENGISDGTNADGEITREQLAVMLYRYVGEPEYNHEIGYFEDHDETSDWALAGKKWAVGNKVINGKDNADGSLSLDPTGSASRAETAQIIMNFIKNIKA